jgi:hypothetical protein
MRQGSPRWLGRSTLVWGTAGISPTGGVVWSNGKGMGFPDLTGANRSVCVMVPGREGVRLTCGVREALGLTWHRLGGEKDVGQFGEMG